MYVLQPINEESGREKFLKVLSLLEEERIGNQAYALSQNSLKGVCYILALSRLTAKAKEAIAGLANMKKSLVTHSLKLNAPKKAT